MLEDLAFRYIAMPEGGMRALAYLLVIVGGVAGALTDRSAAELKRAPYFALTGAAFAGGGAVSLISMSIIVPAMAGGFLWLAIGLELLGSLAIGFFIARIASARSRDAFGSGKSSFLAFIPIANFWLLLKGSRQPPSANHLPTIPLLSGGLGVFFGFIMLAVGAGVNGYTERETVRLLEEASQNETWYAAVLSRNIRPLLRGMASEVNTPTTVDEVTTLIRIEVDDLTLRYFYQMDPPLEELNPEMQSTLVRNGCSLDDVGPMLDAGAIFEHVLLRPDGTEIGRWLVNSETCNEQL